MNLIKLFSTVGTTPKAVANAIAAHMLKLSEKDEIHCYFIVGSAPSETFPNRTSSNIDQVILEFNDNKSNLSQLKKMNIHFHSDQLIDIYEQDLVENVALLVQQIAPLLGEEDRVILDITGGRKIMTGSVLLSIGILKQKKPSCSFEIAYYWLKHFTQEYLNRKLYQLGFDAYRSILTSTEEIDKRVRELRT